LASSLWKLPRTDEVVIRLLFLDAAHHCAEMAALNNDPTPSALVAFMDFVRDLGGEALLDLQTSREYVDYPGELLTPSTLRWAM